MYKWETEFQHGDKVQTKEDGWGIIDIIYIASFLPINRNIDEKHFKGKRFNGEGYYSIDYDVSLFAGSDDEQEKEKNRHEIYPENGLVLIKKDAL